jgi:hypothetical protein
MSLFAEARQRSKQSRPILRDDGIVHLPDIG